MTHTRIRSFLLALFLVLLTLSLTACYTITLKEKRIDGSFFNVMGLPIQRVYTELNQFIQSIKNNP